MPEAWKWTWAAGACIAWALLTASPLDLPPAAVLTGSSVALLCACLLTGWCAPLLQAEVSPAMAAGVVATVAVLPQAIADLSWAWGEASSGTAPGLPLGPSHRTLVGVGWPLAVFVYWALTRRTRILFREGSWVELLTLFFTSAYSFLIVLKRSVSLFDTLALAAVFGLYVVLTTQLETLPAARPGPFAAAADMEPPWRQVAMAVCLFVAGSFLVQSWWSFATQAQRLMSPGLWAGWGGALVHQLPLLLTGLALIAQDMPALGLRVLVAAQAIQSCLPVGLAPVAGLISERSFSQTLSAEQTASALLTASLGFYGFLLLSGMELSLAGAAALAGLWALAAWCEGPLGSYVASAVVMGACVALVLARRRAFSDAEE